MPIEAQAAPGPIPNAGGRPPKYPYATMLVGEFFFIIGASPKSIGPHAWDRARTLGRKFALRQLWMMREGGVWVEAEPGSEGAVKGVGVYRTE